MSHSAIYEKADTSKPDVKAIDINQKVAGQSQERGAIPLLYCCTAEELEGGVHVLPAVRTRLGSHLHVDSYAFMLPALTVCRAGIAAIDSVPLLSQLSAFFARACTCSWQFQIMTSSTHVSLLGQFLRPIHPCSPFPP